MINKLVLGRDFYVLKILLNLGGLLYLKIREGKKYWRKLGNPPNQGVKSPKSGCEIPRISKTDVLSVEEIP